MPDAHGAYGDAGGDPSGTTPSSGAGGTPLPGGGPPGAAVPRVLCDTRALTAEAPATAAGALWKLDESGRQLDANVVHLRPGQCVDTHAEPDLDVLLHVLTGDGTLGTVDGARQLAEGVLLWLPRGSARSLTAGRDGLSYLTVHPRRLGMQIRHRPERAASEQPPP
ncbi:hypothetical protein LHJ74_01605 [Streptomyces sp. N2-109]|uniref:AraC-type arabinose-binding/dimerisation domain-containing protein n=1 Tax=Streptomyces gossypii TaxID=2883101 RepID=A0ABT2JLQ3_9ACTN|nr:hypothetical protein [Streptomyces gossypii]MCT2588648.1 hypothetical protein [Streptomyces gossypii]